MRFWLLCSILLLAGCWQSSAPPLVEPLTTPPSNTSPLATVTPEPQTILDQMVIAYQTAISYSDRASVQIIGKMSQPDTVPAPKDCVVAFQKPNKLYLKISEGILVSEEENCYAAIQSLPDQVLCLPAPESWTLDTLFHDVHIDSAMRLELPASVLRFPPQLVLLLANNPLNTFFPKGAKVEWVEQQTIGPMMCHVIRISHSDGSRILWISQNNQALLRLDYQPVGLPVPAGFESIETIRIEMTDARFAWDSSAEAFSLQKTLPAEAVQVAAFHSDTPGLPNPEEHQQRLTLMKDSDTYRQIDRQIESISPPRQFPPPKEEPQTFTLSRVWTVPLLGVHSMAFLPDATPKLLVPYEGNRAAVLDLHGNILQKVLPEGLENTIIMNIKSNSLSEKRKIGIITLDGEFYLSDESIKPLAVYGAGSDENKKETIRDFLFVPNNGEELLLLGILQNPAEQDAAVNSIVRAVDLQGVNRWEYSFQGELNQISSAMVENERRVLVSCTAAQSSILALSPEGVLADSLVVPYGRHVVWFHMLGSTIYVLLEDTDTGDVRFAGLERRVGLDGRGKSLWGRLLPFGEYEVDPVYVVSDKKWLVPTPGGVIFVFDLIGNKIDQFSLDIVPTGLLCVEVEGESFLIVGDGETVSAWKIGKIPVK